ncbi:DUF1285 domain-containing protein [Psychrobacter sp. I-STPA6b]|uniref:DUF1285 domain-containing protein n=1 Tax=Psychrobacter sp. I-STPA6b TaxID=2585718 RepID=UPI001D0C5C80|nr:DUF1285 domain-containing protein [Psychrobacter sp. I-STPA6b]
MKKDIEKNKNNTINNNELNNIDSLSAYIKEHMSTRKERAIPPLADWHPENIEEMDLVIKANGEWWHEGTKMTRQSLINLFATILWKEEVNNEAQFFLKTPVQKMQIHVEDVPFFITDINLINKDKQQWIEFLTSTGDIVYLDDEHQITMRPYQNELRPYIPVRFGMYALITRNVYMHLIQIGTLTENGQHTTLTLNSAGKHYAITVNND